LHKKQSDTVNKTSTQQRKKIQFMKKFIVNLMMVFAIAITYLSLSSVANASSPGMSYDVSKPTVSANGMSYDVPTVSSINETQFTTESSSSKWNLTGDIYGSFKITSQNSDSQTGTYLSTSGGLMYDIPSVWHMSLTFDSSLNNVTIVAKSEYKMEGVPNPAFDWSYTSSPGSISPANSLAIGSAWNTDISGMNINISAISINGASVNDIINAGGAGNYFGGVMINNGSTAIRSVDYTMTISMPSYAYASSPDLAKMNTSIFIPSVNNVPEPSTWALMGMGLLAVAFKAKRSLRSVTNQI
jgi:hypothetical protein